jgi:hypothetical protein
MNYRKITFAALEGQLISQLLLGLWDINFKTNFNTIPFLTNLTKQLHDDFKVEYREEGAPLRPDVLI